MSSLACMSICRALNDCFSACWVSLLCSKPVMMCDHIFMSCLPLGMEYPGFSDDANAALFYVLVELLTLLIWHTCLYLLRGAVLVCLLPWLQTLLSQHTSSIVSQESSLSLLNSLYQVNIFFPLAVKWSNFIAFFFAKK